MHFVCNIFCEKDSTLPYLYSLNREWHGVEFYGHVSALISAIDISMDNSNGNIEEPSKNMLELLLHVCAAKTPLYLTHSDTDVQAVFKLFKKYEKIYKPKANDESYKLVCKAYNSIFRRMFYFPDGYSTIHGHRVAYFNN